MTDHTHHGYGTWSANGMIAMHCGVCGLRMGIGPSNDEPPAVQEEILAAELGQNPEVWSDWHNLEEYVDDDLTALGVRGLLDLGATSPEAQHAFLDPPAKFQDQQETRDYWAGWLARDIAGVTEPDDTYHWDPSRPVAGQWEAQQRIADVIRHTAADAVTQDGWQERVLLEVDLRTAATDFLDGIGEPVGES